MQADISAITPGVLFDAVGGIGEIFVLPRDVEQFVAQQGGFHGQSFLPNELRPLSVLFRSRLEPIDIRGHARATPGEPKELRLIYLKENLASICWFVVRRHRSAGEPRGNPWRVFVLLTILRPSDHA